MVKDIEKIIGQPEGPTLEYKVVVSQPSLIAKNLAAFANSEGGLLVFGVRDDLSIVGLEPDVPVQSTIESALSMLNPRPNVHHYFAEIDGKRIYVVEIEKSKKKIVGEAGDVYTRKNDKIYGGPSPARRRFASKFEKIDLVFRKLENLRSKSTLPKVRLIDQYICLMHLIERSRVLLFPKLSSEKTSRPEGKALGRLVLSSLADTFENYLADLLFEIFLAKPETLKSSANVSIQEVLEFQEMAEFIRFVANKKVSSLKKGNVKGLIDENKQLRELVEFSEEQITRIDNVFQIRHLYTHNNGRVDTKFEKHTAGVYKQGDEHVITVDELCETTDFLLTATDRIDKAAITKYSLSTND